MYQSFVSTATPEPGNSGAFNFSVFITLLKARIQICCKIHAKRPGSLGADNHVEQQLGVVLMKRYKRGHLISTVNVQARP